MSETIKDKDCLESYIEDMVRYSIGVNRRRAIPDIKDSLKPVQRRILYSMNLLGVIEPKQIKSQKITGDTMGNFHPHGDSSIYDAMAPMANWWQSKIPLIKPDGNWGNYMGDSPAAPRYTEASISKFGYKYVLEELKETTNVVDWSKNYDDTKMEPNYLPVKVPLLLINGAYGIGLGMMTEVPTHNFHEVIEATRTLLHCIMNDQPTSSVDIVLVPDHCLPCKIIDTDWKEICKTGRGSYRVRGEVKIGEFNKCPALFVKSLPNRVTTNTIVDKLNEMVEKKELPMVKDILDSSGGGEMNIIIQLRPGSDPYYMREVLYKKTKVEESYTVNMEVVSDIDPKRVSYKEYLESFIAQRVITKFRLYCSRMQAIMTRWHQLDTYIKVLESGEIDFIIDKIKKQKTINDTELIEYLIKKFKFTDLQAKFIIESNLKNLSLARLNKYKEEAKILMEKKEIFERIIMDEKLILKEIDDELVEADSIYGRPRLCKVIKASDDNNIPKGDFLLAVTENNYLRKVSPNQNITPVKGDNIKFILKVDNRDNVLLFDEKGKVFKLPVFKLPVSDKGNPGVDVRMIIKGLTANIISVLNESFVHEISKAKRYFVTVVTENNYIKKLDINDFLNVPLSGLIYTKLTNNDTVKAIDIINNNLDVIIYSGHKALRMPMSEVPHYKRASQGVLAMNTNDKISGLSVILPDAEYIVVTTTSGKINKYSITGLERSARYKAGTKVIKLGKNDSIFSIYGMNDNNTLVVITHSGRIEIPVKDIPVLSSISSGTKMINIKGDNIIRTNVIL